LVFAASLLVVTVGTPTFAAKKYLKVGGGTVGGSAYILASGIAKLIEKYIPDVSATAEPSSVVANVPYVNNKEMDIAFSQLQAIQWGYKGEKYMAKFGKCSNVRGLIPGPISPTYWIVLPNSPIKSLYDIKGKTISMGGVEASAEAIEELLKLYGLQLGKDYQGKSMGHAAAVEALKDGNLDLAIPFGAIPSPAAMEAVVTKNAKILPIEMSKLQELASKYPFFAPIIIPGGTFPGHPNDIPTLTVSDGLIVHKDMDEGLAYNITKVLIEHVDELIEIHPGAAEYKWEVVSEAIKAKKFMDVPLHPGAERYYRERGIL
jgi:TRAP transporter TAXI family solute receptor